MIPDVDGSLRLPIGLLLPDEPWDADLTAHRWLQCPAQLEFGLDGQLGQIGSSGLERSP